MPSSSKSPSRRGEGVPASSRRRGSTSSIDSARRESNEGREKQAAKGAIKAESNGSARGKKTSSNDEGEGALVDSGGTPQQKRRGRPPKPKVPSEAAASNTSSQKKTTSSTRADISVLPPASNPSTPLSRQTRRSSQISSRTDSTSLTNSKSPRRSTMSSIPPTPSSSKASDEAGKSKEEQAVDPKKKVPKVEATMGNPKEAVAETTAEEAASQSLDEQKKDDLPGTSQQSQPPRRASFNSALSSIKPEPKTEEVEPRYTKPRRSLAPVCYNETAMWKDILPFVSAEEFAARRAAQALAYQQRLEEIKLLQFGSTTAAARAPDAGQTTTTTSQMKEDTPSTSDYTSTSSSDDDDDPPQSAAAPVAIETTSPSTDKKANETPEGRDTPRDLPSSSGQFVVGTALYDSFVTQQRPPRMVFTIPQEHEVVRTTPVIIPNKSLKMELIDSNEAKSNKVTSHDYPVNPSGGRQIIGRTMDIQGSSTPAVPRQAGPIEIEIDSDGEEMEIQEILIQEYTRAVPTVPVETKDVSIVRGTETTRPIAQKRPAVSSASSQSGEELAADSLVSGDEAKGRGDERKEEKAKPKKSNHQPKKYSPRKKSRYEDDEDFTLRAPVRRRYVKAQPTPNRKIKKEDQSTSAALESSHSVGNHNIPGEREDAINMEEDDTSLRDFSPELGVLDSPVHVSPTANLTNNAAIGGAATMEGDSSQSSYGVSSEANAAAPATNRSSTSITRNGISRAAKKEATSTVAVPSSATAPEASTTSGESVNAVPAAILPMPRRRRSSRTNEPSAGTSQPPPDQVEEIEVAAVLEESSNEDETVFIVTDDERPKEEPKGILKRKDAEEEIPSSPVDPAARMELEEQQPTSQRRIHFMEGYVADRFILDDADEIRICVPKNTSHLNKKRNENDGVAPSNRRRASSSTPFNEDSGNRRRDGRERQEKREPPEHLRTTAQTILYDQASTSRVGKLPRRSKDKAIQNALPDMNVIPNEMIYKKYNDCKRSDIPKPAEGPGVIVFRPEMVEMEPNLRPPLPNYEGEEVIKDKYRNKIYISNNTDTVPPFIRPSRRAEIEEDEDEIIDVVGLDDIDDAQEVEQSHDVSNAIAPSEEAQLPEGEESTRDYDKRSVWAVRKGPVVTTKALIKLVKKIIRERATVEADEDSDATIVADENKEALAKKKKQKKMTKDKVNGEDERDEKMKKKKKKKKKTKKGTGEADLPKPARKQQNPSRKGNTDAMAHPLVNNIPSVVLQGEDSEQSVTIVGGLEIPSTFKQADSSTTVFAQRFGEWTSSDTSYTMGQSTSDQAIEAELSATNYPHHLMDQLVGMELADVIIAYDSRNLDAPTENPVEDTVDELVSWVVSGEEHEERQRVGLKMKAAAQKKLLKELLEVMMKRMKMKQIISRIPQGTLIKLTRNKKRRTKKLKKKLRSRNAALLRRVTGVARVLKLPLPTALETEEYEMTADEYLVVQRKSAILDEAVCQSLPFLTRNLTFNRNRAFRDFPSADPNDPPRAATYERSFSLSERVLGSDQGNVPMKERKKRTLHDVLMHLILPAVRDDVVVQLRQEPGVPENYQFSLTTITGYANRGIDALCEDPQFIRFLRLYGTEESAYLIKRSEELVAEKKKRDKEMRKERKRREKEARMAAEEEKQQELSDTPMDVDDPEASAISDSQHDAVADDDVDIIEELLFDTSDPSFKFGINEVIRQKGDPTVAPFVDLFGEEKANWKNYMDSLEFGEGLNQQFKQQDLIEGTPISHYEMIDPPVNASKSPHVEGENIITIGAGYPHRNTISVTRLQYSMLIGHRTAYVAFFYQVWSPRGKKSKLFPAHLAVNNERWDIAFTLPVNEKLLATHPTSLDMRYNTFGDMPEKGDVHVVVWVVFSSDLASKSGERLSRDKKKVEEYRSKRREEEFELCPKEYNKKEITAFFGTFHLGTSGEDDKMKWNYGVKSVVLIDVNKLKSVKIGELTMVDGKETIWPSFKKEAVEELQTASVKAHCTPFLEMEFFNEDIRVRNTTRKSCPLYSGTGVDCVHDPTYVPPSVETARSGRGRGGRGRGRGRGGGRGGNNSQRSEEPVVNPPPLPRLSEKYEPKRDDDSDDSEDSDDDFQEDETEEGGRRYRRMRDRSGLPVFDFVREFAGWELERFETVPQLVEQYNNCSKQIQKAIEQLIGCKLSRADATQRAALEQFQQLQFPEVIYYRFPDKDGAPSTLPAATLGEYFRQAQLVNAQSKLRGLGCMQTIGKKGIRSKLLRKLAKHQCKKVLALNDRRRVKHSYLNRFRPRVSRTRAMKQRAYNTKTVLHLELARRRGIEALIRHNREPYRRRRKLVHYGSLHHVPFVDDRRGIENERGWSVCEGEEESLSDSDDEDETMDTGEGPEDPSTKSNGQSNGLEGEPQRKKVRRESKEVKKKKEVIDTPNFPRTNLHRAIWAVLNAHERQEFVMQCLTHSTFDVLRDPLLRQEAADQWEWLLENFESSRDADRCRLIHQNVGIDFRTWCYEPLTSYDEYERKIAEVIAARRELRLDDDDLVVSTDDEDDYEEKKTGGSGGDPGNGPTPDDRVRFGIRRFRRGRKEYDWVAIYAAREAVTHDFLVRHKAEEDIWWHNPANYESADGQVAMIEDRGDDVPGPSGLCTGVSTTSNAEKFLSDGETYVYSRYEGEFLEHVFRNHGLPPWGAKVIYLDSSKDRVGPRVRTGWRVERPEHQDIRVFRKRPPSPSVSDKDDEAESSTLSRVRSNSSEKRTRHGDASQVLEQQNASPIRTSTAVEGVSERGTVPTNGTSPSRRRRKSSGEGVASGSAESPREQASRPSVIVRNPLAQKKTSSPTESQERGHADASSSNSTDNSRVEGYATISVIETIKWKRTGPSTSTVARQRRARSEGRTTHSSKRRLGGGEGGSSITVKPRRTRSEDRSGKDSTGSQEKGSTRGTTTGVRKRTSSGTRIGEVPAVREENDSVIVRTRAKKKAKKKCGEEEDEEESSEPTTTAAGDDHGSSGFRKTNDNKEGPSDVMTNQLTFRIVPWPTPNKCILCGRQCRNMYDLLMHYRLTHIRFSVLLRPNIQTDKTKDKLEDAAILDVHLTKDFDSSIELLTYGPRTDKPIDSMRKFDVVRPKEPVQLQTNKNKSTRKIRKQFREKRKEDLKYDRPVYLTTRLESSLLREVSTMNMFMFTEESSNPSMGRRLTAHRVFSNPDPVVKALDRLYNGPRMAAVKSMHEYFSEFHLNTDDCPPPLMLLYSYLSVALQREVLWCKEYDRMRLFLRCNLYCMKEQEREDRERLQMEPEMWKKAMAKWIKELLTGHRVEPLIRPPPVPAREYFEPLLEMVDELYRRNAIKGSYFGVSKEEAMDLKLRIKFARDHHDFIGDVDEYDPIADRAHPLRIFLERKLTEEYVDWMEEIGPTRALEEDLPILANPATMRERVLIKAMRAKLEMLRNTPRLILPKRKMPKRASKKLKRRRKLLWLDTRHLYRKPMPLGHLEESEMKRLYGRQAESGHLREWMFPPKCIIQRDLDPSLNLSQVDPQKLERAYSPHYMNERDLMRKTWKDLMDMPSMEGRQYRQAAQAPSNEILEQSRIHLLNCR